MIIDNHLANVKRWKSYCLLFSSIFQSNQRESDLKAGYKDENCKHEKQLVWVAYFSGPNHDVKDKTTIYHLEAIHFLLK
jgi:hypothetical protein